MKNVKKVNWKNIKIYILRKKEVRREITVDSVAQIQKFTIINDEWKKWKRKEVSEHSEGRGKAFRVMCEGDRGKDGRHRKNEFLVCDCSCWGIAFTA